MNNASQTYIRTKQITAILVASLTLCSCASNKRSALNHGLERPPYHLNEIIELDILDNEHSKLELSNNSYELDANKSLDIEIASHSYTRFSIEDERITDVFIFPQEAAQVRELGKKVRKCGIRLQGICYMVYRVKYLYFCPNTFPIKTI